MFALGLVSALAFLAKTEGQCISENDALNLSGRPDLDPVSQFGVRLFKEVVPPKEDFIFSPFSIWTALVLAYLGSNGNTKSQMEEVLHLTNREHTLAIYREVDELYKSQTSDDTYTINSANRLYINDDLTIKCCLQSVFSKELKLIDFSKPKPAAAIINSFVKEETRGKIPAIVSPDSIQDALAVIVNAVYFKGFWQEKFDNKLTCQEKFYTTPDDSELVDMMSQHARFRYKTSDTLQAQVVELDYRGGLTSMFVILPYDKGTGNELDEMIERLDAEEFSSAMRHMYRVGVDLKFPKFKFKTSLNDKLKKALIGMGMADLFNNASDLTNFVPKGGVQVSKVIHKAVVEVNEEGAEAAAATAVVIELMTTAVQLPKEPISFVCNRPFLFAIWDYKLHNLLFLGTFRNKEQTGS